MPKPKVRDKVFAVLSSTPKTVLDITSESGASIGNVRLTLDNLVAEGTAIIHRVTGDPTTYTKAS